MQEHAVRLQMEGPGTEALVDVNLPAISTTKPRFSELPGGAHVVVDIEGEVQAPGVYTYRCTVGDLSDDCQIYVAAP